MQTRLESLTEAATGTTVGLVINWVIVYATVKLVQEPALATTISVSLCTLHSFVRGYALRRWFARREARP